MPILEFRDERNRYEWVGSFEDRLLAKNAGFCWDGLNKVWYTYDESTAYKLKEYIVSNEPSISNSSDPDTVSSYAIESDFYPPVLKGCPIVIIKELVLIICETGIQPFYLTGWVAGRQL